MAGFAYFPHTEDDIRAMLRRIGVGSLEDLYADVPQDYIYKGEYDLPDAMSEQQVRDFLQPWTPRMPVLRYSSAPVPMIITLLQ